MIIDDPTAALGGLHGSKLLWEGLEKNVLDFGRMPSDRSTTNVIDPMSITEFEFSTNKPSHIMMEFDEFAGKVSGIFEYKLFDMYTNGEFNNNPIVETSTTIDSKYIVSRYPGTFGL